MDFSGLNRFPSGGSLMLPLDDSPRTPFAPKQSAANRRAGGKNRIGDIAKQRVMREIQAAQAASQLPPAPTTTAINANTADMSAVPGDSSFLDAWRRIFSTTPTQSGFIGPISPFKLPQGGMSPGAIAPLTAPTASPNAMAPLRGSATPFDQAMRPAAPVTTQQGIPGWEQAIYNAADTARQQETLRANARNQATIDRGQMQEEFHNPALTRQNAADAVETLLAARKYTGIPVSDTGFSQRPALASPAWLQQRNAEQADLNRMKQNWANSRDITPVDTPPTVIPPQLPPRSPGEGPMSLDAYSAAQSRAARSTPEYREYMAKSKKYLADRNAGLDAAHPGPLTIKHTPIDDQQIVRDRLGREMTYGDYKKEMLARRMEHDAARRQNQKGRESKEMVSQKARGEKIDPDMASVNALRKRGEEIPPWLLDRARQNHLAQLPPALSNAMVWADQKAAEASMMSDAKNRETDALERNARGNILLGLIENENAIANDEKQPRYIRDAARENSARYSAQLDDILNSGGSMAAGAGTVAGTPGWLGGEQSNPAIQNPGNLSPQELARVQSYILDKQPEELARFLQSLAAQGKDIPPGWMNAMVQIASGSKSANVRSPHGEYFPFINSVLGALGITDNWRQYQDEPFKYKAPVKKAPAKKRAISAMSTPDWGGR